MLFGEWGGPLPNHYRSIVDSVVVLGRTMVTIGIMHPTWSLLLTLERLGHYPKSMGHDFIFQGSWRLQVLGSSICQVSVYHGGWGGGRGGGGGGGSRNKPQIRPF